MRILNSMPPPMIPASRSPQQSQQRVVRNHDVSTAENLNLKFSCHDNNPEQQIGANVEQETQKLTAQNHRRQDARIQAIPRGESMNRFDQTHYHEHSQSSPFDGQAGVSGELDHFAPQAEPLMNQPGFQGQSPSAWPRITQARGERVSQSNHRRDAYRFPQERAVNGNRMSYTGTTTSSPRKMQPSRHGTTNSVASPFFKKASISRFEELPQRPAFRYPAPVHQNHQPRLVSRQGPVEYRGQKTTNGVSFIQEPETAMQNRLIYPKYTAAEPTTASMRSIQDESDFRYRHGDRPFEPPPQTPRRHGLGTVPSLPSMQPSMHGPYTTPSRIRHGMGQQDFGTIRSAKAGGLLARDALPVRPTPMSNIWSSGSGRRVMR